jgi:phage tail sheath protein FI
MSDTPTPGVYYRWAAPAAPPAPLRTGVPAFLGLALEGTANSPESIDLWGRFGECFRGSPAGGFLGAAVRGFFANGGELCWVVRLDGGESGGGGLPPAEAVRLGLEAIEDLDDVDLVCLPDASRLRLPGQTVEATPDPAGVWALQRAVADHCEAVGTRIAILDSLPEAGETAVLEQRQALSSANATLYHPWILVASDDGSPPAFVPPCGHVAGIYASTDRRAGVHGAPANEVVVGALGLESPITDDVQAALNPAGVNCLRAFPGRGIRVWGARTLSADAAWTHVSVRRLLLTAGRWIAANLSETLFEPNGERLRARVRRELGAYLTELHRLGALRGETPEDAFFVRCDAETNTGREPGRLVAEVGLATSRPNEFIVVHVVQEAGGVSVVGPTRST